MQQILYIAKATNLMIKPINSIATEPNQIAKVPMGQSQLQSWQV